MVNEINSQTFVNLINFLLKKWQWFLIVGIFGAITGIVYSNTQKVKYQSTLTFALDEGESDLSGELSMDALFGANLGVKKDIFAGDNIIQIIKSRYVIEKTFLSVDTFDNKPYTFAEYYCETENKKLNDDSIIFPVCTSLNTLSIEQENKLYKLYKLYLMPNLVVQRPDRRLGIYEVNITAKNEIFCKKFTNRLLAETNKFYIESCTKKAKQAVEVLERRIAGISDTLNSSISDRAFLQDANVNPDFLLSQVPILQKEANEHVYKTSYEELYKNLENARFRYLKKLPLMQIIDAADYPLKKIGQGKLAAAFWFGYIFQFILLLSLLGYKTSHYIQKLY